MVRPLNIESVGVRRSTEIDQSSILHKIVPVTSRCGFFKSVKTGSDVSSCLLYLVSFLFDFACFVISLSPLILYIAISPFQFSLHVYGSQTIALNVIESMQFVLSIPTP